MKSKKRPTPSASGVLEERCRKQGLPVTWQRQLLYETLRGRSDHPSADDLYLELKPRVPQLSRMTVYRALETLVFLGLASRAAHPGATARFDAVTDPHHHLLCEGCGRLVDLDPRSVGRIPAPTRLPEDFEIRAASIYFRGLCASCRPDAPGDLASVTFTKTRSGRRTRS